MHIEDWGCLGYAEALARQRERVEARMQGEVEDTVIFVEHPPVYTLGARKGAEAHLLWSTEHLQQEGIEVIHTNRGGDITYHGPGQLVVYVIADLSKQRDLHLWLRALESWVIAVLAEYGLSGQRREGLTGIWIGSRKIAALGVAVRQWISYHGLALNVNPQLRHFEGIVPCGIQAHEGTVTSLENELAIAPDLASVKACFTQHLSVIVGQLVGGS